MSLIPLVHIITGTAAVVLGAVTLAAPKGRKVHIMAGRAFIFMMLASSAFGAALGLLKWETLFITFQAGVLAIYLVVSGWLTAIGPARERTRFIVAAALLNLGNVAGLLVAGVLAMSNEGGQLFGFPAENYFFLSVMGLTGAVGDVRIAFRRALSEKQRIARHLWRMCLGFFIAAGSAFTGPGAKAFPEAVRQSGLLSVPEFVILALLLFWLFRTLLGKDPRLSRHPVKDESPGSLRQSESLRDDR